MFYCAGNWKMNLGPSQVREFASTLLAQTSSEQQKSLLLFPQALLAQTLAEALKGSDVAWGGQNCHFETKGAFTGENSPLTLKEMGARFCLVGHSERRHIFGETDDWLAKKVTALQANGLTPILCVGEKLEERKASNTEQVIVQQLRDGLKTADKTAPLWIAYEPVWAIGTGLVATPDQVAEAHAILRGGLEEWSAAKGKTTPILYGGSVKSDNSGGLAQLPNVDGFLIGGASLDPKEFLKILQTAVG
jgi:triosephosphate isomerase